MSPLSVALWRYVFAVAMLLPIVLRSRALSGARASLGETLRPLAVMIVAGGILYPWLFLTALEETSATNTSLLIALNPVITLLLVPLVGEAVVRSRLIGALIAFLGAAIVITKGDPEVVLHLGFARGDVLAVVAAACWAGYNLASRSAVAYLPSSLINLVVYGAGAGAFALLGHTEDPVAQIGRATAPMLLALLVMAGLSSVLAGQLFLAGVRAVGVGRSVVFVYLVPVVTAALSTTFLDERLEAAQALGGAAVLFGVWQATRES
jgi:drug/metabolite transporter (DMT)-like permease